MGYAKYTKLEQKIIDKSYALIESPQSRFKHFTFLVRRNKILNVSWNHSTKTHPYCKRHGYRFGALHSEVAAIIAMRDIYGHDFKNLKVYNVRINNLGKVACSAPCFNCSAVLKLEGFRDVYFTNDEGRFEVFNF